MADERAVLGGGCFWCLDALFRSMRGVNRVECGYAAGFSPSPTYEAVCSGKTGHAEVLRIEFDSSVITYSELLEVFFSSHDPTTPNRQGHDVGTQYRSIIVCQNSEQRAQAEALIAEWNRAGHWPQPIVTEVHDDTPFYPAEGYHQDYYARNPEQGYCAVVIAPKLAAFRNKFARLIRG